MLGEHFALNWLSSLLVMLLRTRVAIFGGGGVVLQSRVGLKAPKPNNPLSLLVSR